MDVKQINEVLKPLGMSVGKIWRDRTVEIQSFEKQITMVRNDMRFVHSWDSEYSSLMKELHELEQQKCDLEQED